MRYHVNNITTYSDEDAIKIGAMRYFELTKLPLSQIDCDDARKTLAGLIVCDDPELQADIDAALIGYVIDKILDERERESFEEELKRQQWSDDDINNSYFQSLDAAINRLFAACEAQDRSDYDR
jgi:hypothetical protein